jgi:hypothetical protein
VNTEKLTPPVVTEKAHTLQFTFWNDDAIADFDYNHFYQHCHDS